MNGDYSFATLGKVDSTNSWNNGPAVESTSQTNSLKVKVN
jgi:hypothetical protein